MKLEPVRNLATNYLSHLLIATRNAGGRKTPQASAHPTPDLARLRSIQELLHEAMICRKQSALKELIYRRDGRHCPITSAPFDRDRRHVVPRCAHILPFSFRDKPFTLQVLERFTGNLITAETVREYINHPANAINIEPDAHESFDQLAWGIEAQQQPGGEWRYIFREVGNAAWTIRLNDGDEIRFGQGTEGQMLDPPNPLFCNLKLALARVMHACGAADIIAELYGDHDDDDAIMNQPVHLGGPFVSDDTLFRRIHDRLSVEIQ